MPPDPVPPYPSELRVVRRIAVIIPYFQRERGILQQALRSIVAQTFTAPTEVELLIIDDSSPIPAQDELADMELPPWLNLRTVQQSNAGPAAARNHGLDQIGPDIDYVAFLDSDDSWAPDHLQQGVDALELGHDFYFCDSAMPPSSLFASLTLFAQGANEDAFEPLPLGGQIYRLQPDRAGQFMVQEYLCQTSAVILRRRAMRDLRFEERLRYAGEDWLMWVRLAHSVEGICFSKLAKAQRGEGINLYRDAHERLGAKNLRRLMSMVLANRLMKITPGISAAAACLTDQRIMILRREMAAILLHPRVYQGLKNGEQRRIILDAYRLMNVSLLPLWRDIIIRKMRWHSPRLDEAMT
ncbi:glycosyltransferase family 2 protein [Sphingobium yanoikuyae]|uniref:Glycosyltransferase family 2 protein n=1 Tax=Sphingobium yanoikuyae TaxID=13690 RepID=A0A6M4G4U9_SPHYA|nr:glycosyltransferase family 2 protein [Sphingobium yanoikuyae]QJR02119.1 glycosyltransferase family 2 protein [Sphingobium yanoikuyae]